MQEMCAILTERHNARYTYLFMLLSSFVKHRRGGPDVSIAMQLLCTVCVLYSYFSVSILLKNFSFQIAEIGVL